MATCKQTATELLQDLFSPCVAVLCSEDVETICAKNNLTFVEMVQPFCRITSEITIRDPSNVPFSMRNLRIVMKDMHSQPPHINIGKKVMHDAVAANATISTDGVMCNTVIGENYQVRYNASTPWFEAYREVFFQVLSPMEHEFLHHYLSCIFVVSSSHHDPLSQIHDLCQQQAQIQLQNSHQNNSRWFFTHTFKYYLLLHDTSAENLAKAETIYQSMKSSYGSSCCHLLQINSSKSENNSTPNSHEEMNGALNLPDPWIQFFPKYYPQQDPIIFNDAKENSESTKSIDDLTVSIEIDGKDKKDIIDHPLQASSDDQLLNDSYVDLLEKAKPRPPSLNYGSWGKNSNRNKKHGLCLTLSDMDRVKVFVQDFCIQGLIPYVEKQMRVLNDLVTNRKGIHRTIFGVTKKLFAGNKPGGQGPITSMNSVMNYGQDAPELQVRKLGDLAFMFQLYEAAYQAYHTAKRDFSGDQAWLFFAGASEMAALSVFMQGNSNLHEYPARYMETAITTYLHTCKVSELAMRATFLSTECLKAKGLYRDAALQFMRMPSEADLPCALFLEQAAHCFICCKPPKLRKFAFHMVLSGHRFSKAGQKKHGLRCYRQAQQAYSHIDWNFANNHIHSMIGRFSMHLNHLDSACEAFKQVIISQCHKPTGDHSNQLRDYLLALKQSLAQPQSQDNSQLPSLPVPFINCQSTKVLLGEDNIIEDDASLLIRSRGFERADLNNEVWAKLEEMLVSSVKTSTPFLTPQMYCYTQDTTNSIQPIAVANEIITIEVSMRNPLNTQLTLENIFLLWTFTANPDVTSNKEPVSFSNELEFNKTVVLDSVVQTTVLQKVVFEPLELQKLRLALKPVRIGTLLVRGLSYSLLSPSGQADPKAVSENLVKTNRLSLQGKQLIEVKGPRLNRHVEERTSRAYAIDNRLNIEVVTPLPKLEVKYKKFPESIFCGEIRRTLIEFTNVGHQVLHRIIMACPSPTVFTLGYGATDSPIYSEVPCVRHFAPVVSEWTNCDWKCEVKRSDGQHISLKPGESYKCVMFLRGPDTPGEHNIELLMYYEMEQPHPKLSYRLLQHSFVVHAKPSLSLQASAMMSQSFEEQTILSNQPFPSSGSLILSMEAENISEELEELSVMQVSCASPEWHLSSSCENLPKGLPVILQRECYLMSLKASSLKVDNRGSSQETVLFSRVPLGCFEIDSNSVPCWDFTNKSRIHIPNLKTESLESCPPKPQSTLLLLTVIWKAQYQKEGSSHLAVGQHHIKISNLTSAISVSAPQWSETGAPQDSVAGPLSAPITAQLVRCCLRYPFHVQHDFKKLRLKTVPVDFIAQSTCDAVLQVTVDNSTCHINQPASYTSEESQVQEQQLFTWVNGSKRKIQLKPSETARIRLCASFSSPGTYNLGGIGISISNIDEEAVNYIMPPYLIIISACGKTENL